MKKIFTAIIALVVCSMMSWAETEIVISLNPSTVDFGTVSLSEGYAEGSAIVRVNHPVLEYCSAVDIEYTDVPEEGALFSIDESIYPWAFSQEAHDWVQTSEYTDITLTYLADTPGSYTGKIGFTTYTEDWADTTEPVYLDIKLVVTNEATAVDQTAVKVKARKYVQDGQLVIEKNGALYNVLGTKL